MAGSTMGVDEMRYQAIAELHRAVAFERWCVSLVDPESLCPNRGLGAIDWFAELPAFGLRDAECSGANSLVALVRGRDHTGVLSAVTGGDLARSWRWREIAGPYGGGDELRCALVDPGGCWGSVHLFRDSDQEHFDARDAQLMREAAPALASAIRQALVRRPNHDPQPPPRETGVLLLGEDLRPLALTSAASAWFALLNPPRMPVVEGIPTHVWATVGRLLAIERGEDTDRRPRALVRAGNGVWTLTEAARLNGAKGGIAVSIRAAGGDDVLNLLCRVHGFTARERQLTALVFQGLDTHEIARLLHISRHTVQDHLKSIFEKVGVRSRRELITRTFGSAAADTAERCHGGPEVSPPGSCQLRVS